MSKVLAIRYIIYRVAQEFNKFHGKEPDNIIFFNDKNNFTLEKCLLLPYIITIANGNKNFFLDGIFKNAFIPSWENDDKKVLIGDYTFPNFKIYTAVDLGLKFNPATSNLIFEFKPEEFKFEEELIEKHNRISYNINYSIKFFQERRYSNFAILSQDVLKKITYQNSAYDVLYDFFRDNIELTRAELAVLFNAVAKETFYFTSFNERIEEDVDTSQI